MKHDRPPPRRAISGMQAGRIDGSRTIEYSKGMVGMSGKFTPAPGALYDGGSFRIYDNRIEIDKIGFFGGVKGIDVIYYSDIISIQASRRQLIISRSGWKTSILDFKKQEQVQQALNIINTYKA